MQPVVEANPSELTNAMADTLNPIVDVSSLMLRVKELEEQQLDFRNSLVCAFNQMLDLKDINTGVHSTRLAEWALRVARKMEMPEDRLYQVEARRCCMTSERLACPTTF